MTRVTLALFLISLTAAYAQFVGDDVNVAVRATDTCKYHSGGRCWADWSIGDNFCMCPSKKVAEWAATKYGERS